MDGGQFGEAIHALLKELGWSHGELTPSLVYQALAQVRHLRKQHDRMRLVYEAAVEWRRQHERRMKETYRRSADPMYVRIPDDVDNLERAVCAALAATKGAGE